MLNMTCETFSFVSPKKSRSGKFALQQNKLKVRVVDLLLNPLAVGRDFNEDRVDLIARSLQAVSEVCR